jgi:inner membrane protein
MMGFLGSLGPWGWLSIGGVLLILEMAAPGVFFIWLGLAAVAVGLLTFAVDLAWQIDIAIFAVLSVLFLLLIRPWYERRNASLSDRPNLNQRMYDYVGQSYVLEHPLKDGRGKLRIDDTLWDVLGPDTPAGARVKVSGVEGLRLRVEQA